MQISDINVAPDWIPIIAHRHFEYWGPLTGADNIEGYAMFLQQALSSNGMPSVLVAREGRQLLGSVNLVACDCRIHPELTPWLAQLFVEPEHRGSSVGAALVRAITERAAELGFTRLYLYTGGTLPEYYTRLGWVKLREFFYLGKQKTLMAYAINKRFETDAQQ